MPLKDLPPDARPREKLIARGPAALSDVELLAILLRTGIAGKGVLQMAQELLAQRVAPTLATACAALPPEGAAFSLGAARRENIAPTLATACAALPPEGVAFSLGAARRENIAPTLPAARGSQKIKNNSAMPNQNMGFGGIAGLLQATSDDLKRVKGLGPAKRAEIMAVMELARRAIAQQLQARTVFDSPLALKEYAQMHLFAHGHEVFCVLFLDAQSRLITWEELFRGTLSQTSVYPREVVLRALHHRAAAVVLAHNHPSGSTRPSPADEALTRTLKAALGLVDVRVLDHIIVAAGAVASMAELGLM